MTTAPGDPLAIPPTPAEAIAGEIERARDELDRAHAGALKGDAGALEALPAIARRLLTIGRPPSALPPELEIAGGAVIWRGAPLRTTPRGLRLARYLAGRVGTGCAYHEIQEAVHGRPWASGSGAEGYKINLRASVSRLRRAFLAADPGFDRIEAMPGYGYRWKLGR